MQKVFVVEDSQPVRERLLALLAAAGLSVIGQAESAREAIDGILATRPDAVVLDLNLARGTGFDVLREVRKTDPAIDFYMLSNFASEPYRRYAEQLGARGFFDKTNEFEQVSGAIAARATKH
jgi:DNA-binding NarL/FixJ family response regulator